MYDYETSVQKLLKKKLEALTEKEKYILKHLTDREPISRNIHVEDTEKLTFGQKLADRVASFGGSWPFIIIFICVLVFWIALNVFILLNHKKPFDPYPFILLNLFLSMLASIQAPVIMMSQNRQSAHDRAAAEHDYEVNLKSELEIMALHEKIDELRNEQWQQLMDLQMEQIRKIEDLKQAIERR